MNKKVFTLFVLSIPLAVVLGISRPVFAFPAAQQGELPQITFLGEGPDTFSTDPPLKLLVKTYQDGVFYFTAVDGTTYEAKAHERVWSIDAMPAQSIRLFEEQKSFGDVPAGCAVHYVQIDDNVDGRRNTFFINGKPLQTVEQGWVTYGSFIVPEAGELTFFAEDSIGLVANLCQVTTTEVPTETTSPTSTFTVTPSMTPTVTFTPTAPFTATPSVTPTVTTAPPTPTTTILATAVVQQPTQTPTVTATRVRRRPTRTPTSTTTTIVKTATVTLVPLIVQTQTRPAATATATSLAPTPGFLPVTGGGPGPREIAAGSAVLIGLLGLTAAAWWVLLRFYRSER